MKVSFERKWEMWSCAMVQGRFFTALRSVQNDRVSEGSCVRSDGRWEGVGFGMAGVREVRWVWDGVACIPCVRFAERRGGMGHVQDGGRLSRKPSLLVTSLESWLLRSLFWPIMKDALATLRRLKDDRLGGKAMMTRLLG